jgi:hypothetical protein
MPIRLRIATFNLENFDERPAEAPTLTKGIAVMRPQLIRLEADVLCPQQVNGQEEAWQSSRLLALQKLLAGTPYANYHQVSPTTIDGVQVYDERNRILLSRYPTVDPQHYIHNFAPAPRYQKVTAQPRENNATEVTWERPILYAKISLDIEGCSTSSTFPSSQSWPHSFRDNN